MKPKKLRLADHGGVRREGLELDEGRRLGDTVHNALTSFPRFLPTQMNLVQARLRHRHLRKGPSRR